MGNVLNIGTITKLPLDPTQILQAACHEKLARVVIIGETEDGQEYFAASEPGLVFALWDLERAKHMVMKMRDEEAQD